MPREYSLRLDKYGIDRELYNELSARCRRYPDWLNALKAIRSGANGSRYDGQPRVRRNGDPTSVRAMMAIRLSKNIDEIEQAAMDADASLHKQIILNVTRRIPYECMSVPCGRRQFYEARRRFFLRLAQIREKG